MTHRWENRVFTFLLAVTEVNIYCAKRHFEWNGKNTMTLHKFRKQLAFALIENDYLKREVAEGERARKCRTRKKHEYLRAPPYKSHIKNGRWVSSKAKYQCHRCRVNKCSHQILHYWKSKENFWLCKEHFNKHYDEALSKD